ncbi:hypothetical protein B0I37DRAFT_426013 [Chaetomium sp. MPI-CAGE-AT-0009]|nr:hypothetical protein B0I37DRAFT_426013 [Chaetomium sp. MPI-CAGE-AT-0009]
MGLFSFLSRRTGDKSKSSAPLKALPYDSSFSVETPTLDGYSVAGSNSYAENPHSRGHSAFTQSALTLDTDTDSEDEQSPPSPKLPRFRDESVERPSTAPSDRPSSAVPPNDDSQVTRNGQRRPPPLSFRGPRAETAAPGRRPASRGSITSITSVFRRTGDHSRVNSLRQDPSKAFKDLLDAQSEIKPADSRARVQAAGARDYGEDVAERNMGQNGCDLGSEHVKAFYAQPRRTESGNTAGTKKLDPYKAGVRRRSVHSSQHILPTQAAAESPFTPNLRKSRKGDVVRRRSVSTYLPPGLGKIRFLPFDRTSAYLRDPSRTPPLEGEKSDVTTAAPESPRLVMPQVPKTTTAPTTRATRLLRDSVELRKMRAEVSVPEDSVADDSPASNFAAWSANRSRRSSAMLMPTSPPRRHQSLYTLRSSGSSIVSQETVHTTPLSPPNTAPGDQIQGATESSAHCATGLSEDVDAHTNVTLPGDQTLGFPPSIRTRSMRGWSASSGTPTACESSTAASITTSTFNNRPRSFHTADTSIDLSIGTISPKLKPARSFTRTCHDSDSEPDSPSNYENKEHADITFFPPETTAVGRAFNIEDYLSPESGPNPTHTNEDMATTTTTTIIPAAPAPDTFNMDDYLSSDPDHRRRPTAEGEESLLFQDCEFGVGGQLPGLADPFPAAPVQLPRSRGAKQRHSALILPSAPLYGVSDGLVRDDRRWAGAAGSYGVPAGRRMSTGRWEWARDWDKEGTGVGRRRFILDTAADDETASESDGEEMDNRRRNCNCNCNNSNNNNIIKLGLGYVYDVGYEADYVEDEDEGGARQRRRHREQRTRRLSALCRLEGREGDQDGVELREQPEQGQRAEEEKKVEDKVAAAVRLRKEVRRARRLAGEPSVAGLRRKAPVN